MHAAESAPPLPVVPGPYQALVTQFSSGDVIFGLDAARRKALFALEAAGVRHAIRVSKWFGLRKVQKIRKLVQNDLTDAVWSPWVSDRVVFEDDRAIRKALLDGGEGVAFKHFLLQHPRYAIAGRTIDAGRHNPIQYWRKTSKAGLEFHVRQGRHVHFVLDGLDFAAIASKTDRGGQSVTSSELRWLYRRRNHPLVRQQVRLYLSTRELAWHEVFGRPEWQGYQPGREYDDTL